MADETTKRDLGEVGKLVAVVLLVALLLLFIVLNNDRVEIDFLVFDVRSRIWVALLGTTIVGAVLGYLLANLRKRR